MSKAEFMVTDAMKAPHGGWILRLRLESGEAPSIRQLKKGALIARSPEGEERRVRIKGFPLFAGTPSDERLASTGRLQIHVADAEEDAATPLAHAWRLIAG